MFVAVWLLGFRFLWVLRKALIGVVDCCCVCVFTVNSVGLTLYLILNVYVLLLWFD